MEIAIIGSGAIGGVLGAYLAKGGEKVVFCDIDKDHVEKIRTAGIRIEGPDEEFDIRVEAFTPEELLTRNVPLDWVFICTKAQHAQQAVEQVFSLLNKDSKVVSFQNGLTDLTFPPELNFITPLCCFVNFSADYLEPGRVLYGGVSSVAIGEYNGLLTDRLHCLKGMLEKWGPVIVTNNIVGFLWSKLSYASLLYATALVDETMSNVVANKEYRPTLIELCVETLEAANCKNIRLQTFDVWKPELLYPRENQDANVLDQEFDRIAFWMSKNKKQKSGIWRDLAVRKRNTEVEFDLRPLLDIGSQYHQNFQMTEFVVKRIKEIEQGRKEMSWDNLREMKQIYEIKRENIRIGKGVKE